VFDNVLTEISRHLLQDLDSELRRLEFYLGGGSGLALQLGHRISEDLDFFTVQDFQPEILSRYLETKTQYQEILISPGTLYCTLHTVKLSFIRYPVPLLHPIIELKGIDVADWRDILAEKFKTLSQRGSRKDFYDIYACYTLGNFAIGDGVEILKHRFAGTGINYYHILKSLGYFEDAENEPELILLMPITWQTVKSFFLQNLKEFEKYLLADY
jgi:hypothetical protein